MLFILSFLFLNLQTNGKGPSRNIAQGPQDCLYIPEQLFFDGNDFLEYLGIFNAVLWHLKLKDDHSKSD